MADLIDQDELVTVFRKEFDWIYNGLDNYHRSRFEQQLLEMSRILITTVSDIVTKRMLNICNN